MPLSPRPETRMAPTPASNSPTADDWSLLFGAVTERLRRYAAEASESEADVPRFRIGLSLQDGVLDCVAALEQLHTWADGALGRAGWPVHELHDAPDRLACPCQELEGRRIGERQARQLALRDDLTTGSDHPFFHDRIA